MVKQLFMIIIIITRFQNTKNGRIIFHFSFHVNFVSPISLLLIYVT